MTEITNYTVGPPFLDENVMMYYAHVRMFKRSNI